MSMASTTIYSDFSNMEVSPLMLTTSSSVIMSTEVNNLSKLSAFFWLTRSSTQRTSSCWEETTSVLLSTESMVSTTSARDDTTSSFGKPSLIASTVYLLLQSLMRRSYACTVVCPLSSLPLNRSRELWDLLMFLIPDFSAISFGQIPTKMSKGGVKTIVEYPSLLVRKLCQPSTRNTTLTSFAELIKS